MRRREILVAWVAATLLVGGGAGCSSDAAQVDAAPRIDATPRADADPNAPDARRAAMDGMGACVIADATGSSDTDGHMLAIPAAAISNQVTSVFTSTGGDHTHNVLVSAANFAELSSSCAVTLTSNDMHPHTWTITIP